MANKAIEMSKLRRVLQLHLKGKSKLFISKYLGLSRNTVDKYIAQSQMLVDPIEVLVSKTDAELERIFIEKPPSGPSKRLKELESFFPYMSKMLTKTGVTKTQLWEEYIKLHPDGYRSSQFCEYYNRWGKRTNPVMHMTHKAGDKVFIDYAGKKPEITDRETGEITETEFFVAVLGASQYTYAEASMSQGKEHFIESMENGFWFFEGVSQAIVPDNLKSAVTKSDRYEPTLNETFLDFAEHYGTTILPARAYRPRDKSLVEGAVRILYNRIYSSLRDKVFYSLKELNTAIWEALEKHNNTKFSGRPYSRYDLFVELEKQQLGPLPLTRYEIKREARVTVMQNGHVLLGVDKHYYSVPYQYIRKKVKILYSSSNVEVFYKHNRIAVHPRSRTRYSYTTTPDHMASTHKFMMEWTPQRFINWAEKLDESVKELIIQVLDKKQHPEQAYKSCMGILSLEKKVGTERLVNACKRALEYNIHNYKIVKNILEKNLDEQESPPDVNETLPEHQNVRGRKYYQ